MPNIIVSFCISTEYIYLLNQECTGQHVLGFLKLLLSAKSVCVCVCVCPEAINYMHMIFNLYNQLNKSVAFRNTTKRSMYGCGLCNKARCDRNQSNKAMLVPERVVLMAIHE